MSNRTSLPPPEVLREIRALWDAYNIVYFITGILIAVLAIITVVGNGVLLLAIWKDPFKSFRTPTTFFVIGLSLADFITGAILGPCLSYLSFLYYLKLLRQYQESYKTVVHVCSHVASITMNASFFVLLALTWSQFIVIHYPYKHKDMVTKRRVIVAVVLIWLYSILVSLLFLDFGVPHDVAREIDIHLNTNTVLVLLLVAYVCLLAAYFRHLNIISPSLEGNKANQERRREQERRFTSVNLLLATFLLVFTLPSIVIWHLELYRFPAERFDSQQQRARFAIAQVLAQALLMVKFALDPFAYAWRLPNYRRAFKKLLTCGKRGGGLREGSGFEPGYPVATSGTGDTTAQLQERHQQLPKP